MLNQKTQTDLMDEKTRPIYMLSARNPISSKDTYRLKVRGWKNILHATGKRKKARVAILISDKINVKIKITGDKEGHYIMIKGSIQEEGIAIVNIYAPSIGEPQYTREILRHKRRN